MVTPLALSPRGAGHLPNAPDRRRATFLVAFAGTDRLCAEPLDRELLRRAAAPALDGARIALSLSDGPDLPTMEALAAGGAEPTGRGLTDEHVWDVTALLTWSLVRAGAALGYGGDHRKKGYTEELSDLIEAHKRTTKKSGELLYNYIAAYLYQPDMARRIHAHFEMVSGKQEQGQVKMHNEQGDQVPISAKRLAGMFAQYPPLRLVILDTCWSLPEARSLARTVEAAMGVAGETTDDLARDFYALFFNALANGSSLRHAHQLAFGLQLARIEGDADYRSEAEEHLQTKFDSRQHLPRLITRRGVDANAAFLAG